MGVVTYCLAGMFKPNSNLKRLKVTLKIYNLG